MADVSEAVSEIVKTLADVSEPVSEIVKTSADVSETASEIIETSTDVPEPVSEIVKTSTDVSKPVSEIVKTSTDVSELVSEIVKTSADVSEPVSETVKTSADISEPVSRPARKPTPLHLEDMTSMPLKTMLERASTVASNYMSDLCEQAASLSVGQFLLHKVEDALWAVEKSVEWSASSDPNTPAIPAADEKEINGSPRQEPVPEGRTSRPVPWIIFIPILVMWRGTRMIYETASSLLGKAPVRPDDVVQFLRNRRRGMRALRIRGKRTMNTHGGSSTVLWRMTSFVNPLVTAMNKTLALVGFTTKKASKRDLEVSIRSVTAEEEGKDSAKESVLDQLNRMSNAPDNVNDDPDFEPDSSVSSEGSSSSGANASEEDKDVATPTEAPMPPRTSSFIAEIIEEEEEEETTDLDTPTSMKPTDDDGDDGDFASLSASLSARSSDIFTDTCESNNSAMQKISSVFKKGLTQQNSF